MNPLVIPDARAHEAVTALSINLNKVALMRNARGHDVPSLALAATRVLEAGAQGITVHPRPDQRHIRADDVPMLAALLKDWPQVEFNIEGNPFHNLMDHVQAQRPHQATFVPDGHGQLTSDHGWQLPQDIERLQPLVAQAQALGVRVSLFMDPDPAAMALAAQTGANRVELYTEAWDRALGTPQEAEVLARYRRSAEAAQALGLEVNAGHDLNRRNLTVFLRGVPGVREVSIGQALIADALELGYTQAVCAYLRCIRDAHAPVNTARK